MGREYANGLTGEKTVRARRGKAIARGDMQWGLYYVFSRETPQTVILCAFYNGTYTKNLSENVKVEEVMMFRVMVCMWLCVRILSIWISYSLRKQEDRVKIIILGILSMFLLFAPYFVLIMMIWLEMVTLSPPQMAMLLWCDVLGNGLRLLILRGLMLTQKN